jgi:hypothetical protein
MKRAVVKAHVVHEVRYPVLLTMLATEFGPLMIDIPFLERVVQTLDTLNPLVLVSGVDPDREAVQQVAMIAPWSRFAVDNAARLTAITLEMVERQDT